MEPTQDPAGENVSTKQVNGLPLLMLSVVAGTCLILVAAANSAVVHEWMRETSWQQSKSKKLMPLFCTNDHFIDAQDRILHDQIPSADFSRGGVHFVGACNLAWGLKLWEEPAAIRSLVRNFGVQGTSHADQFDMIRFLVENEGLLKAGAEKTLIVLGTDYHVSHEARVNGNWRMDMRRAWTRRGFYTIDQNDAIHRAALSPAAETIIRERVKITGFLKELVNIAYVATPLKRARVHDPNMYREEWKIAMHSDWQERIRVDLAAFAETINYLKSHGAKVAVIEMPRASWDANIPFNDFYDKEVPKICNASEVKYYDFSRLVNDDDFASSSHLTPNGVEKLQAAVRPIYLEHLRSIGALTDDRQSAR
jgi:hypothetical protein